MSPLWLIAAGLAGMIVGWALRSFFNRAGNREAAQHAVSDLDLIEDARRTREVRHAQHGDMPRPRPRLESGYDQ